MDPDVGDDKDGGLAQNRSRRLKVDKHGRKAALERFREARHGQRSKFDISEEQNIYEEVDEVEYSKIVRSRQDDDWIVDDGTGYVEDGREIFDDDIDEKQPEAKKKRVSNSATFSKASRNPNIRPTDSKPSGIREMFAAAVTKPKVQKAVSLEDDDILGDIMGELKGNDDTIRPAPIALPKRTVLGQSRVSVRNEIESRPASSVVLPRNLVVTERDGNRKTVLSTSKPNLSGNRAIQNTVQPPPPSIRINKEIPKKTVTSKSVGKASSCDTDFPDDDISGFESQSVTVNIHQSQVIEDDEDKADMSAMCDSVDVSGIDFNDNFELETTASKTKAEVTSSKIKPGDVTASLRILSSLNSDVGASEICIDTSKLPLINVDGHDVLRIYWLDAFEDYLKQPGVVYLFGKVWVESASNYVSCCLTIKQIERRVFLLPRKFHVDLKTKTEDSSRPVSSLDVYQEFNSISERYKIMRFKSINVTKQYSFDKSDIPSTSEYMEIRYAADLPALPSDLCGQTFSHVFSTNTSALETFLLDRKIKGPCWLEVTGAQVSNQPISWCRLEAIVNGPDHVKVSEICKAPPPPLVVMAMTVRTAPHPKTHQNEIVAFAGLVHNSFCIDRSAPVPPYQSHFCAVAPPAGGIFPFDFRDRVKQFNESSGQSQAPSIELHSGERALLGYILAKIHKIDPDVIIGHDVTGYDFDVLLHRVAHNKVPHWSKLGRLKRANMPRLGARSGASAPAAGRLVLDSMISARELIRCRSYDLTEVVSHVLKQTRRTYDGNEVRAAFNKTQNLFELLESTVLDATFSLRIASDLNVLPLAAQITNICGNVLSRTLAGGRSERNEYLLLHAFSERQFIVPDKVYGKKPAASHQNEPDGDEDDDLNAAGKKGKSSRKKPAYTGGLVLEPKKGFYDKFILLVDFNSLYPSIIQEYNICFTTVKGSIAEDEDFNDALLPEPGLEPGVLPTEIRRLVESRKQVRQLMKSSNVSPDQMAQYDIRQRALKLTANSLYGCLGFTASRFYARRLAAMITGKGREILLKTKDLVQALNLDVIYGDTDSLMIATGTSEIDEVYRIGNRIKQEVNKLYRHLEIDIDGVYKSMLLLKKKKYAALSVEKVGDKLVTKQEMKGLDMVRRDWCTLAKDAGVYVVGQILSGESRETVLEAIHSRLMELGNAVRAGDIPLEEFTITKQLTKNPEEYPDRKSLPHVQVAMRLNTSSTNTGRKFRAGDTVAYIVCDDGTSLPATQRAYHPDIEFAKRTDLKIDVPYYLEHQVHPVVARLCDPIEGTDAARIAECLGIDATGFRHALRRAEDEEEALLGIMEESDAEKYRDCEHFSFPCHICGIDILVNSVESLDGKTLYLAECGGCKTSPLSNLPYLRNRLTASMRRQISRYYEGWLVCEDIACASRSRRTTLTLNRGQPVCTTCHHGVLRQEVSEKAVYLQFGYFKYIFDVAKVQAEKKQFVVDKLSQDCLDRLKWDVERVLNMSAYSEVNLSRLFKGLFPAKPTK